MALISQVSTADGDAWNLEAFLATSIPHVALPIGELCAAMWLHATDILMSVASDYIVLDTVGYKL